MQVVRGYGVEEGVAVIVNVGVIVGVKVSVGVFVTVGVSVGVVLGVSVGVGVLKNGIPFCRHPDNKDKQMIENSNAILTLFIIYYLLSALF